MAKHFPSPARKGNLRNLAYRLDMHYREEDAYGLSALLRDFDLMHRKRRPKVFNILTKQDEWLDMKVHLFDFVYVKGKKKRPHYQTVFFMRWKDLALPQFLMKPETLMHKIGSFIGIEDIDFEEYPTFSNQYYLKGDDEEYIRYTMKDEVLKFFTVEKDWHVEGINFFMILYKPNTMFSSREMEDFYHKGLHICRMLRMGKPGEENEV